MTNETKVVGKGLPLIDGKEKVTGKGKYTADINLKGMLYARVLGSPHPHAKIKRINTNKAKQLPGVVEVITYENTPRKLFFPVDAAPRYPLHRHLRYTGEPVAVVAAETEEIAEEALGLIEVEYEVLPTVFDAEEAVKPGAVKLYPNGNIVDPGNVPLVVKWGDVEKAFKEADVVVEGTFKTSAQNGSPIEPRASVANWDGEKLTVWVTTQTPHRVKDCLNQALGLPISKMQIITHFMGGGFGNKKEEEHPILAAFLSMTTSRPVKLEYSREEEFILGPRRHSAKEKIKLGAKKDGTITAISFEAYYDLGAHGDPKGGSCYLGVSMPYMYKYENALFKGYDVNVNLPDAITIRGIPYPAYHFGLEQLVDQIAEKLDIDPIEMRRKNTYRTGDITKPYGAKLSNYAIEECMNKAIKASDYKKLWKGWGKPVQIKGSKRMGIGVGLSMGWTELYKEQSVATVKIYPDATAEVITGAQDIGTGCNTTLTQIAAEELGLPFDKLRITTGDTSLTTSDLGSFASRTTYCSGSAVKGAARQAKETLLLAARRALKAEKQDLQFVQGEIRVDGKAVALSDVISEPISGCYQNKQTTTAEETLEESDTSLFKSVYVGAAVFHIAEVEVDTETGEVKVLKYAAAQDAGKAINPLIVQGQNYGGVLMGLGFCLKEEIVYDKDGRVSTPNFIDYKIFDFQEAPPIDISIVESQEPSGPFGAVGVGEFGINPASGTIANAIYNAIGVRLHETPMTPERILKAMGKIK
jgi:CO/xanthine dehydrogenase Mo-binding subunit